MVDLIPILKNREDNSELLIFPQCREIIDQITSYYNKIGYNLPWIGYLIKQDDEWVGSAGFKGGPAINSVEIAYVTFEHYRSKGIGTSVCAALVKLARQAAPEVTITARTLPEPNHSTRILEKNNFYLKGTVTDPEDGDVWEWVWQEK